MTTVRFDLSKTKGKIKPMNAVNNGPAGSCKKDGKHRILQGA